MMLRFYALDRAKPTLTITDVGLFEIWAAMRAELADYYRRDAESFGLVEASWRDEEEYAEVVTLNGRIIGALDRPLSRDDVSAISRSLSHGEASVPEPHSQLVQHRR